MREYHLVLRGTPDEVRAVIATGAIVLVSGNIGCLTQLRLHLATLGSPLRVRHAIQIVRDAYAAPGNHKHSHQDRPVC